jgi:hypothetical protein
MAFHARPDTPPGSPTTGAPRGPSRPTGSRGRRARPTPTRAASAGWRWATRGTTARRRSSSTASSTTRRAGLSASTACSRCGTTWPPSGAARRRPSRMFFRAHDNDCIEYHLVNLVPDEYKVDDFQVQTPTDVIGQHIHLVKFDVTSSDGAANGFNYEDGSLSPEDVRERIAPSASTTCAATRCTSPTAPRRRPTRSSACWARRRTCSAGGWTRCRAAGWADHARSPRCSRTTTSGPARTSRWGCTPGSSRKTTTPPGATPRRGRCWAATADGGPTSWRADILYPGPAEAKLPRVRHADRRLHPGLRARGARGAAQPAPAHQPAGEGRGGAAEPAAAAAGAQRGPPGLCPNQIDVPPCPEIISADDPGTMRSTTATSRWRCGCEPRQLPGGGRPGRPVARLRQRWRARDDAAPNYGPYGARPGELPKDPFTPLMRVYEDDRILVRLLVGAHEEGHNWGISGTRWQFERTGAQLGVARQPDGGDQRVVRVQPEPAHHQPAGRYADFQYEARRWTTSGTAPGG